MKNLFFTASLVLASFGAFASTTNVKSDNIVAINDNIEIISINNTLNLDDKQAPICTVGINLYVVSFSYSWEC